MNSLIQKFMHLFTLLQIIFFKLDINSLNILTIHSRFQFHSFIYTTFTIHYANFYYYNNNYFKYFSQRLNDCCR